MVVLGTLECTHLIEVLVLLVCPFHANIWEGKTCRKAAAFLCGFLEYLVGHCVLKLGSHLPCLVWSQWTLLGLIHLWQFLSPLETSSKVMWTGAREAAMGGGGQGLESELSE